ncbi:hypothetical protein E7Z59_07960 [Robertkochia marina]|uniref:DoxX family protein n=1 Tax=Robertkochia marina TaxID=1227945 RepID=A0A4V3UY34_9FLAO|nr:DUF6326 family protein [Robertkochia marina]THD67586.1 hypothetical protein E7Z59_07960 [Robertkochia marina]TRZ44545.1 hypothetical protein D3A96_07985 [Robertkochia marina]
MSSDKIKHTPLTNTRVDIKIKLALLWTSLMFLYIYADYFRLMTPEKLDNMMNLQTPMGPTTPELLVIFSGILIIPALMIVLSIMLPAKINKWMNMVVATIYASMSVMIISSSMGVEWQNFFVLFNVVELLVFTMIVVQAWKWPRNK